MDKAGLSLTAIRCRTSSCTRDSIRHGTCRTTRRSAVAMMRTAIRPKSDTSTATSTPGAGKTENTSPFRRKRSSATGTIPTAETTSALHRLLLSTHPIPYSASHWEAPHEIHHGEWQDALPAITLLDVQSADPDKLSAGSRNPSHLLRSQMLRRSLQKRGPASRKNGPGIMNSRRANTPGLWPKSSDVRDGGRSSGALFAGHGKKHDPKTTSTVAGRTMR